MIHLQAPGRKVKMQSNVISEQQKQQLVSVIQSMAADLRPEVAKIESAPPTTKDHYGDYMAIISHLAKGSAFNAMVTASALRLAGANAPGLTAAMRVLGYME